MILAGLRKTADSAQRMTRLLVSHPSQFRYLVRWWPDRRDPHTMARRTAWLTYGAIDWLAKVVGPTSNVFEFGSGGSTLFFADTGARLTSVEHDASWHERVRAAVPEHARARAVLRLVEPRSPGAGESCASGYVSDKPDGVARSYREYVRVIDDQPDGSLDLVLIDGRARGACARHALRKIRPGGFLVLDDSRRQEYAPVAELLQGCACRRFGGLGPGRRIPDETTVWQTPDR